MNTALRPRAMFMVTKRNQISHLVKRSVSANRSKVMPNEVLLNTAAVIDKVPDMFPFRSIMGHTDGSKLAMCWPTPSVTLTVIKTMSAV